MRLGFFGLRHTTREIILTYGDHAVLEGEQAAYGQQVIQRLADELIAKYGKGWTKQQLLHCLKAAEVFHDEKKIPPNPAVVAPNKTAMVEIQIVARLTPSMLTVRNPMGDQPIFEWALATRLLDVSYSDLLLP
jgi:hypothetical protein